MSLPSRALSAKNVISGQAVYGRSVIAGGMSDRGITGTVPPAEQWRDASEMGSAASKEVTTRQGRLRPPGLLLPIASPMGSSGTIFGC